jgi:hypothetical protein
MPQVQHCLDDLQATLDGCRCAVFVDLRSELVLSCSAAERPAQEQLDRLAVAAAGLLTAGDAAAPAALLLGEAPQEALRCDARAITLFHRLPDDMGEALVCLCRPGIAPSTLRAAVQATAGRIAESGQDAGGQAVGQG